MYNVSLAEIGRQVDLEHNPAFDAPKRRLESPHYARHHYTPRSMKNLAAIAAKLQSGGPGPDLMHRRLSGVALARAWIQLTLTGASSRISIFRTCSTVGGMSPKV